MIQELIVTSVPRGLQAGRSGFTTVLRTRGIHPQLAEMLERASGYRHVFPQGDPRNPQIRSHTVVSGAAGVVSVLTRIIDAGSDYSGRSNKLAHHMALDAGETAARSKSNPAAVLLAIERAGGFQRQWAGEPREEPAGPQAPLVPSEPGICQAWARLAGDAGWAGLLADRAVSRQPTWIIAPQGVDLLELFAEALGLVNYPQRWGVTFTTYALSAGDALWLGTVDGSPEAQAARGQSRLAVVDLARRAPLTVSSPTIAAARGVGTVPWKREPARPGPAAVASGPTAATFGPAAGVAAGGLPGPALPAAGSGVLGGSPARSGFGGPPVLGAGGPPPVNGMPPPLLGGASHGTFPDGGAVLPGEAAGSTGWSRSLGRIIAGGLVAVIALVAVGVVALYPEVLNVLKGDVAQIVPPGPSPAEVAAQNQEESELKAAQESKAAEDLEKRKAEKREADRLATKQSAEEAARVEAEEKRAAEERAKQAAAAARRDEFFTLKEALEQARHLPTGKGDWNLRDRSEQSLELCRVGKAEIEVSLPNVGQVTLAPRQPQWRFSCTGTDPWTLTVEPDDKGKQPIPLGRLEVDSGTLTLTLMAKPEGANEFEFDRAREAVTTLPLVLRLKANQSAEFETHVQMHKPRLLDPITISRFLTDPKYRPKGNNACEPISSNPLPTTPWGCRLELKGQGGETVTATFEPEEMDEPVAIAQYSVPVAMTMVGTWTWTGDEEPFMKTTLEMANRDAYDPQAEFYIRLTESLVLPPWNGWERLGDIKGIKDAEPKPLTELLAPGPAKKFSIKVPDPEEDLPQGTLNHYAEMARQYVPKMPANVLAQVLAGQAATVRKSLGEWKKSIREQVKGMPGYTQWVDQKAKAPDGSPPDAQKDPNGHKRWKDAEALHTKYAAAGEVEVNEYWAGLKAEAARHEAEKLETILCCLHFEIDGVLAEKQKTKALLAAVDKGDVTLTGRVWVDSMNIGKHSVLLAEFRDETAANTTAPSSLTEPSPDTTAPAAQPPAEE